ncbi:MAG: phosphoglucosamine mutase [archaeon]
MKLFGTSGIRGIYGEEITEELASKVGSALGEYVKEGLVVLGRDPRNSSPSLEKAAASGLAAKGIKIKSVGMVPTPAVAFAARELKAKAGVMITASHNPAEYNGIKLWNSDSSAFEPEKEREIEKLVQKQSGNLESVPFDTINIIPKYTEALKNSVQIEKKFKIVLDCGHGAACPVSPELLADYGEVTELFCEADGDFPGRKPEPSGENLGELKKKVLEVGADIGIAHDGDADRIGVVDETGTFVERDALLALFAKNALQDKKGVVAVPIDTSKMVEDVIEQNGGSVLMTRVGDVDVVAKLKEHKGVFGGEPSGCFIFPDVHLCPDGILGSLKILELLSKSGKKLSELVAELPKYYTIRETILCGKEELQEKVNSLSEKLKSLGGEVNEIDGLRVDFEDSWILVRASGTEPMVRITVEAKSKEKAEELLKTIQNF